MTEPQPDAPARDERWLWLLFWAACALHVHYALIGWDFNLLGAQQFRQVQTALGAAYFPTDHFPLAYELPLFGPPWSLPLEFPLYQASVAWLSHATGLALEPAGRAVSWFYFQTGLPALFLLLGSAGLRRSLRWIVLALLVTSPLYIFYSRAFLIESLAWSAGMWFLAGFARLLSRPGAGWFVVCAVAGSVSAMVKVTTWGVFVLTAAVMLAVWWWRHRANPESRSIRPLLPAAFAFLPSLAAGLAWTWYAKSVRDLNPEVYFLDSHFGFWTFGDLGQRLSWSFWRRTFEVWTTGIIGDAGPVVGLLLFARATTEWRRSCLFFVAAFLTGQLVFSNLYYVHDYYFYASGAFLVAALGVCVASLFADAGQPRWLRWIVPVLLILLQVATYGRGYHTHQAVARPVPEYLEALRALTSPDDMVVVLGRDWDASSALYSGRRTLMLLAGREKDPAGIRESLGRANPHRVGAVLIAGDFYANPELSRDAFASLELGTTPLLASPADKVGIWIPRRRLPDVLERLPETPYRTLQFNPPPRAADGSISLGPREIAGRQEFHTMQPRPVRATGSAGFSYATVGLVPVLNGHAPFELEFQVPERATTLRMTFGIHDAAFADAHNHTDGVTFEAVQQDNRGQTHSLRSLHLDPHGQASHRGIQEITVPLAGPGGTVLVRTSSGPAGNLSFDWAYIGQVVID